MAMGWVGLPIMEWAGLQPWGGLAHGHWVGDGLQPWDSLDHSLVCNHVLGWHTSIQRTALWPWSGLQT